MLIDKTWFAFGAVSALCLGGCGPTVTSTHVNSETQLGRVIVYRNGVAYFERYAEIPGDSLNISVPADKVDDFLKSLSVVDAKTGEPAPVAYPSAPSGGGSIDMKIALAGPAPHRLRLSYVTEAPSWKPTYRAVLRPDGSIDLQACAIVDNTSGEDWTKVKLGVGSSSAMAFRFDLRSLRMVQRETLRSDDLFALAPPVGGAIHGEPAVQQARIVGELGDDALAMADAREEAVPAAPPPPRATGSRKSGGRSAAPEAPASAPMPSGAVMGRAGGSAQSASLAQLGSIARRSQGNANVIIVEGFAAPHDKDQGAASLERANKVRDQLLRQGLDPSRVVAVGRGQGAARPGGGVRIVEQAPAPAPVPAPAAKAEGVDPRALDAGEPVGTSHFESDVPMTVARGTSAMVSILRSKTEGQVVYLYDPETPRGNAQFPFKALRFKNPSASMLERGPVSVFGDGRFIGEGMTDPIPAAAVAFVPFALDRQVHIERKDGEHDEVARILTAARGVFHTEVRHTKRATFVLQSRAAEPVVVYVRHTVAPGFTLKDPGLPSEKLGAAHLFRVELAPSQKRELVLEEHTPVLRTTDIRTPQGLEQIRAFASSGAAGPLADKLGAIVKLHTETAKIEEQIATTREQMSEYRARMDELHAQVVTLRAVKTAGPLLAHLDTKLQEMSDRLSKATLSLVSLEEKRMVARVRLQDAIAELSLAPETSTEGASAKLSL